MDHTDLGGREEIIIDVDTSGEREFSIICNDDKIMRVQRDGTSNFSRGFPNSTGIMPLFNQEMGLVVGDKNKTDKSDIENPNNNNKKKNKKKKKNLKMSSKPPRPPKALSLDASEAKLVREISELAMLKRARMERMERMKALKKMKNAKTSSSSSIWPMIITILFCVVLFWQGITSNYI